MSETRILETHSLPDIDMNLGTPEIFEKAQEIVMGEGHAYPMIAFGTLKKKSAFKMLARATNMDFELANTISKQIDNYETDLKHAEDEDKDLIDIFNYVDPKYHEYIKQSEKYWGIIDNKKKAPCAYLLYDGDIKSEIGLIKCKTESTKREYITTVIDGAIAEKYKFLKNDLLKVNTVLLTRKVFERLGMEQLTVPELSETVENDDKTWEIYSKGWTQGINQCEQASAVKKVMRYKPKNISELAAFIAGIRPGFKSMYDKFESREPFAYGIKPLDNLLQTEQFPYSYILYQEQLMAVLNYAGFPMDQCYQIIKDIAKKHPEKVLPLKDKFLDGFSTKIEQECSSKSETEELAQRVWQIIYDNTSYGFNCVSGRTIIQRGSSNNKKQLTVEEMYKVMSDVKYAKSTGHRSLHDKYKREGYGTALSMYDDLLIRDNKIIDIVPSGIRETYEIKTETGKSIVCTMNHKFPTPQGKKRLDELSVGDEVYCKGVYEKTKKDYSFTGGNFNTNYPQKGQCGFRNIPDGQYVVFNNIRLKKKRTEAKCELCGIDYDESLHFELHHKDGDRTNNVESNLQWLCNSCHKSEHYKKGRTKRYEKGIPTYIDKIESIAFVGEEMTYDIEMADPAHTFVSENGLVVSNCSHAYAMALDSLYGAWQKANHPYEFYEVYLQFYTDEGEKDKVATMKQEMERAFGIKEGDYKWGVDNTRFRADSANQLMIPALTCIKGISYKCSVALYELSQKKSEWTFPELLREMEKTPNINKGHVDTLIKINYFECFGEVAQLLAIKNAYEELNRSQFNKESNKDLIEKYGDIIINNCEESPATYRNFNKEVALQQYADSIKDLKTSLVDKINYEYEVFGYIRTKFNCSEQFAYVLDVNKKYKNKVIKLHRLKTGEEETVKVRGGRYDMNPIEPKDIIKTLEASREKKWKPDGNGGFVRIDELETILNTWSKVNVR